MLYPQGNFYPQGIGSPPFQNNPFPGSFGGMPFTNTLYGYPPQTPGFAPVVTPFVAQAQHRPSSQAGNNRHNYNTRRNYRRLSSSMRCNSFLRISWQLSSSQP